MERRYVIVKMIDSYEKFVRKGSFKSALITEARKFALKRNIFTISAMKS